jgi:hypothetical protein
MKIELRLLVELPFALNLPDDLYEVNVDGKNVPLRVRQGLFAGQFLDGSGTIFGTSDEIAATAKSPVFLERLRTVIELRDTVEIDPATVQESGT